MTILITGATGLIGSALRSKLIEASKSVYCQSRYKQKDTKYETWIPFDLKNSDEMNSLKLPEIDTVFHLASQTSLGFAKENPIEDLKINVEGFVCLLNKLKNQKKRANVVLAGTTTQVGIYNDAIISEKLQDSPESFYDLSKLTAERYLKQFIKDGYITGSCLRLANVFGASSDSQMKDRGIIDKIFMRALQGEEIFIYGKGDFLRDYIYLEDVVSAFLTASEKDEELNGGHYIIASGKSITLREAFEIAIEIASEKSKKKSKITYQEIPENISSIDLRSVRYNTNLFSEKTGWTSKYDLESGLRSSYKC